MALGQPSSQRLEVSSTRSRVSVYLCRSCQASQAYCHPWLTRTSKCTKSHLVVDTDPHLARNQIHRTTKLPCPAENHVLCVRTWQIPELVPHAIEDRRLASSPAEHTKWTDSRDWNAMPVLIRQIGMCIVAYDGRNSLHHPFLVSLRIWDLALAHVAAILDCDPRQDIFPGRARLT